MTLSVEYVNSRELWRGRNLYPSQKYEFSYFHLYLIKISVFRVVFRGYFGVVFPGSCSVIFQ